MRSNTSLLGSILGRIALTGLDIQTKIYMKIQK